MKPFAPVIHDHRDMMEGARLDDGPDHGKFLARGIPDIGAVLPADAVDQSLVVAGFHQNAVSACVAVRATCRRRQVLRRDPRFQAETAVRHGLKRGAIERHEIRRAVELDGRIDLAGHARGRAGGAATRPGISVS